MIDLNKEAEEYYNNNIDETNIPREHYEKEIITLMADFAGNSKFVKEQILLAQIEIYNKLLKQSLNHNAAICKYMIKEVDKLQEQLKQL